MTDLDLDRIAISPAPGGGYRATVTVGKRANGKRDQRQRRGVTPDEVKAKLRKLLREIDAGRKPRAGRVPTVQAWCTTWLTDVAPTGAKALSPRTLDDYWSCCRTWIFPHVGGIRLDTLEPEHLQAMYAAMYRAGISPGRVQKVHAVMRRALEIAMRWGRVSRNVARMMDPPGFGETAQESLTRDEVRAILTAASKRDAGAPWVRWQLGMAIGPRQGETLGLRWPDIDFTTGIVTIAWQLQRRRWRHGCTTTCGRKRAAECPARSIDARKDETQLYRLVAREGKVVRVPTGLVLCRPKGWRRNPRPKVVQLPLSVVAELRRLHTAQAALRLAAGEWWVDLDLVFTMVDGRPLDPRRDHAEWKDLLTAAGLPPARVHVMRHTTATLLLEDGEQVEVVQEVLGHRDPRTTRGYQEVRTAMTGRAARKMDKVVNLGVTDLVTRRRRRQA